MNSEIRKYRLILVFFCLITLGVFLILANSFVSGGHKFFDYTHNPADHMTGYSGYDLDEKTLTMNDSPGRYVTFRHIEGTTEFLFTLFSAYDEDVDFIVKEYDSSESFIKERNMTLEKGKRWILIEDIDSSAAYISISLDRDMDIYEVGSAMPYSNRKQKCLLFGVGILIITALFIVVYKKRLFMDKLIGASDGLKERFNKTTIKGLFFSLLVGTIEVVLAGLIIKVLDINSIAIFGSVVRFNFKTILLLSFCLWGISILLFSLIRNSAKLESYGVIIILLISSLYAFVEPVSNGVSWDDEERFAVSSKLSHILDHKNELSNNEIHYYYYSVALDKRTYDKKSSDFNNEFYDDFYREGFFEEVDDYSLRASDIAYLPMAIGITFARGLKVPYRFLVIMGRWFEALFFTLICFFAMKRLKYGKLLVCLIALIPTSAFLAGSYTYDVWLTALAMLGFSFVFYERQSLGTEMEIKSIVLIPLLFFFSTIAKPVYFVMAVPAIFFSRKKFKSTVQCWIYRGLVALSIVAPFVVIYINNITNPGTGDYRGGSDVNASGQFEYIFAHFKDFILVLIGFLRDYLNVYKINKSTNGYIDLLGYNGLIGVAIPILIVVIVASIISHGDEKGSFPVWYRIGAILLYIGVGALCATTMYISFTPVGANYVAGCQGRYLIPVLFPTLYILTRIPVKTVVLSKVGEERFNSLVLMFFLIINVYCLWIGCVRYY